MKQVTNLLLVGSHKDRLTDGCRVQVYPACLNGVLTVWGGRSCARGAPSAAPQLHAISCNGRDGITVCAVAGAVPVGTVCRWHRLNKLHALAIWNGPRRSYRRPHRHFPLPDFERGFCRAIFRLCANAEIARLFRDNRQLISAVSLNGVRVGNNPGDIALQLAVLVNETERSGFTHEQSPTSGTTPRSAEWAWVLSF
jgi:hypothetical protein